MKKIKIFIFSLIVFMTSCGFVYASCDVSETNKLTNLAVNVKASYEVLEGEYEKCEFPELSEDQEAVSLDCEYSPPDGLTAEELKDYVATYNYINIKITNLTEELYVVVTNELSNEKATYTYQDSNQGVINIRQDDIRNIVNYKIEVYSSSSTSCANTKLYTLTLVTPAYNEYSEYALCEDAQDFYLCQPFVSYNIEDIADFQSFVELVQKYKDGQVNEEGEETEEIEQESSFQGFVKNHKGIIIGTVVGIVVIGGIVTVIIVRKQRSKKI